MEKSFVDDKKKGKNPLIDIIKKKDYEALNKHLEEGIEKYLESDTFKNFLNFMSKFHKYSQKNIRLILEQNPEATNVAGFQAWKKLDRSVAKGSKAIYVYAPYFKDVLDKEGNKVVDENGEIKKDVRFFLTPVFDVSQTIGEKPLPKLVYDLQKDMESTEQFYNTFKALEELSPVPVHIKYYEDEETKGWYDPQKEEIIIKGEMGQQMTIRTLIHEITHAIAHENSTAAFGDKVYRRQEFEAESVAYIVSSHLGLDTSDYSFGYLSSWTKKGNEIKDFSDSLDTITKNAKELIEKVDATLEKFYTYDAPKNVFEERVAIARAELNGEPRRPQREYKQAEYKKPKQEKKETTHEDSVSNRFGMSSPKISSSRF